MDKPEQSAISFSDFILSLATTAAVHFGDIADPSTGEKGEPNLLAASQMIELIALLQEKTRGNLTPGEEEVLTGSLTELRLVFVELSRRAGRVR